MEILLLVLFAGLAGWFFFLRNKENKPIAPSSVAAPYKVETPEPTPAPVVEEVKVEEPVVEEPAKKPRKPRAPKAAEKTVAKKAAVKKAASKPAVRTTKSKKA